MEKNWEGGKFRKRIKVTLVRAINKIMLDDAFTERRNSLEEYVRRSRARGR